MKKAILTATALTLACFTPALANSSKAMSGSAKNNAQNADMNDNLDGQGPGHGKYFFNKMDTNGDGYISKAESEAFGEKMFSNADANNDGRISMQEMADAKKREREEWHATHPDAKRKYHTEGKRYHNDAPMASSDAPADAGDNVKDMKPGR